MSTKVIDETTLRIYFPKKTKTEPVPQDSYSPTTSTTAPLKSIVPELAIEAKDEKETTNTQGFSLMVNFLSP